MKILAAIVTHNRCELLERCIDHLQMQTRVPDLILVVNNGSTDATIDMLIHRNIEFITQENVGSAGGWSRCISYELELNFDAVGSDLHFHLRFDHIDISQYHPFFHIVLTTCNTSLKHN